MLSARSSLIEYGGVAVLLAAVVVVGTVLRRVLNQLMHVPPTNDPIIGPGGAFTGHILLAVVYTVLVMLVVGVSYVLIRDWTDRPDRIAGSDLVTIAGTIGAAAFVIAYLAIDPIQQLVTPIAVDLAGPATMGGLAVGYIQYRDVTVQRALPSSDALPTVLGVVLVAVIAGGGVLFGVGTGRDMGFAWFFEPRIGPIEILRSVVVTGVLGGVGYALLYNAAIQGRLAGVTGPAQAVAAVTVLLPVRAWARAKISSLTVPGQRAMSSVSFAQSLGRAIAAVVVGVMAAWLFARGVGIVQSRVERVTPLQSGIAAVAVVSIAAVITTLVRGYPAVGALPIVTLAAVPAAAAIGYERTRSAWTPTLVFGVYLLLVDSRLGQYIVTAIL
ncbi:putative membrane protein [Halorhabdus sp. SVX81]|nr:putative membrane protein [Halorhabdus sp. SVX81]